MSEFLSATPQDPLTLDAIVRRTLASAGVEYDPTGQTTQISQIALRMRALVNTKGLHFAGSHQEPEPDGRRVLAINFGMENLAAQSPEEEEVHMSVSASDEHGGKRTAKEATLPQRLLLVRLAIFRYKNSCVQNQV